MMEQEKLRLFRIAYTQDLRAREGFQEAVEKAVAVATESFLASVRRSVEGEMLKKMCQHPDDLLVYWADASGNNGGGYECGFCGKDRPRGGWVR